MLKKTKKIAQKFKTMELVHINLILQNKSTIITNFLSFFQFFPQNLPLDPVPDPGGKMNADPCGSGSTIIALLVTIVMLAIKLVQLLEISQLMEIVMLEVLLWSLCEDCYVGGVVMEVV